MHHENGTWRWLLCRGLCVARHRREPAAPRGLAHRHHGSPRRRGAPAPRRVPRLADRAREPRAVPRAASGAGPSSRRAPRPGVALRGVIFLDLDGFEFINDSLGHQAGDQLLDNQVAQRLNGCARPTNDTVARFGGDELALLLERIWRTRQGKQGVRRGSACAGAVRRPFQIAGRELVERSLGAGARRRGLTSARRTCCATRTRAMYRAKTEARGLGTAPFRSGSCTSFAASRLQLEGDLRERAQVRRADPPH